MTSRRIALLVGAVLFGLAGSAHAAGEAGIVRDLASRVGPVIGSAQACRDIARPRVQNIVDKFSQVIREAYVDRELPIAERRLREAAARLAVLLNRDLGQG